MAKRSSSDSFKYGTERDAAPIQNDEKDQFSKKIKVNMNINKKVTPLIPKKGIQIKLSQKESTQPSLKPPSKTVASVFGDQSDEEPEEMPPEARMRMRNIGRDTPTSAGPNSYGKTKQGFCNVKKVFEKNLKEAALELTDDKPPKMKPYLGIQEDRPALPIYKVKHKLIQIIRRNQTVIIVGETGCGKTTQIPQYMYESMLHGTGVIGVTQPRRVAALTISRRVAYEQVTKIGDVVGFSIRFENCTSAETKIKYLTDGMLLREALVDDLFLEYSNIILDEVHERTLNNDILFGLVKLAQKKRKKRNLDPLRIIVMSASMDVDHIRDYFDSSSPVIYLEGRNHPIDIFYNKDKSEDYVFDTLVTIFQIHEDAPANEDILVFLTGQDEIESVARSVRRIAKDKNTTGPRIIVYTLYASLSSASQMDVFKRTPPGCRKVVLSTNIAETSVTISGIKYVVDSGKVKRKCFHAECGLDMLKVNPISQAQACQRAGRAGRESAGNCYRIYTKEVYNSMDQFTVPEILRCNLSGILLQLLSMKIDPFRFNFIDKPPVEDTNEALAELMELGAVTRNPMLFITETGYRMSTLPLDPKLAKILICAPTYNCVSEILTIVSLLSSDPIFITPHSESKNDLLIRRQAFHSSHGDHITFLNVYNSFKVVKEKKKEWCYMNLLNYRSLLYASKVRDQLVKWCHKFGICITSCGEDIESLCKCLLAGLFRNIAMLRSTKSYVTLLAQKTAKIHPSSVLCQALPSCVLFTEIVDSSQIFLKTVTVINPEWLSDVIPDYNSSEKYAALRNIKILQKVNFYSNR